MNNRPPNSAVLEEDTIRKLGHEILEIRLRSLLTVEQRLERVQPAKRSLLLKSLLRWFGLKPVQQPNRVIVLVEKLLQAPSAGHIIAELGQPKILKDLHKLQKLLSTNEALATLQRCVHIVQHFAEPRSRDASRYLSSTDSSVPTESSSPTIEINLSASLGELHLAPSSNSHPSLRYELPWQLPAIADLNSMRLLRTSLRDSTNSAAFAHALHFLRPASQDLPGEYFLQSPYLALALLELVAQQPEHSAELLPNCVRIVRAIGKRCQQRELNDTRCSEEAVAGAQKSQITVDSFVQFSLGTALQHLQQVVEAEADGDSDSGEAECNRTLEWLHSLLDLAELVRRSGPAGCLNGVAISDLVRLMRKFREDDSPDSCAGRRTYIALLDLMCRWLALTASNSAAAAECLEELQCASLDYPLRSNFGALASEVDGILGARGSPQVWLSARNLFQPAVALLCDFTATEDPLFATSLRACDTLSLHRSVPLAERMFERIVQRQMEFGGSAELRANSERLMLRLLAHERREVRAAIYVRCATQVKLWFAGLMEGTVAMPEARRTSGGGGGGGVWLGMPLSGDIMVEMAAFGVTEVPGPASEILLLVLRSRRLLPARLWTAVRDRLLPALPLLQAACTAPSPLRTELLALLNPDDAAHLPSPPLASLAGNVRFLYHPDASVREEAVARLLYALSTAPDAAQHLPKIANIADVIANDLCLCPNPWDAQLAEASAAAVTTPLYDPSTLDALTALLSSEPAAEPAVRRSALLQLSCMLTQPELCARFERLGGLEASLRALRQACSADHRHDYPDAGQSAVALLVRLLANSAQARGLVFGNADGCASLMRCTLRILLLFHNVGTVRRDCAVLLFMASHAPFVAGGVGGGGRLSLPAVLRRLRVPLVHDVHWSSSPFNVKSGLEQAIMAADRDGVEWQFVRFAWAEEYGGLVAGKEVRYPGLDFNAELRLTAGDLRLWRATDMTLGLAQAVRGIGNATVHADVRRALACIDRIVALPGRHLSAIPADLTATLHRFFSVVPNTEPDHRCFEAVLRTVQAVVAATDDEEGGSHSSTQLHCWLLEQMRRKHNPLLAMLRSGETETRAFLAVCEFLQHIWRRTLQTRSVAVRKAFRADVSVELGAASLAECYYKLVVGSLDDHFRRKQMDRVRALLGLLGVLTTTSPGLAIGAEAAGQLANQLLRFVATIKSWTATGAEFNRSCLRSIVNAMRRARGASDDGETVHFAAVHRKYLRVLSGLGGHGDLEVRTLAWSVLAEYGRAYEGGRQLVRELAYLPGGFHACCLSTFLDGSECSLVRSVAGAVFANLLRHIDVRTKRCLQPIYRAQQQQQQSVNKENRQPTADTTPTPLVTVDECIDTVFELLICHRFMATMSAQLDDFWCSDTDDQQHPPRPTAYTSWCVVRTFCTIAMQLLRLRPTRVVAQLHEQRLVFGPLRLLPAVQQVRTRRAVQMMAEMCRFVAACVHANEEFAAQLAADEPAVLGALFACLQPEFYAEFGEKLRLEALTGLLQVLVPVAGRLQFTAADAAEERIGTLVRLVQFALAPTGDPAVDLMVLVMQVLRNLLRNSEATEPGMSFGNLLEVVLLTDGDEDLGGLVCFAVLHNLLKRTRASPSLQPIIDDTKATIALLLQHSASARSAADTANLLADLLDDVDSVLSTQCAGEFVRRVSASKREPIVRRLQLNLLIMQRWFSRACLHAESEATDVATRSFTTPNLRRLCSSAVRLWPWAATDSALQITYLRMLVHASENSLPICQLFAQRCASASANASSLLQLCADYVSNATQRPLNPTAQLHKLALAMRVVTNCCAVAEGRQSLQKLAFLDAMDRLHPSVTKQLAPWPWLTRMWLQFYEVLTRYAEHNVSGVKHLSLLCTFVLKPAARPPSTAATLRLLSLRIIRNMSFAPACRAALIASDELLYTFKSVLQQDTATVAEQLLVCTAIWRLLANCYRAKHALRSTGMPERLGALADRLQMERMQPLASDSLLAEPEDRDSVANSGSDLLFTLEVLRLLFDK